MSILGDVFGKQEKKAPENPGKAREIQQKVERLESRFNELEKKTDGQIQKAEKNTAHHLKKVDSAVAPVREEVENLKEKMAPISEKIEELQEKVEPISEKVENLQEKVEPISEEVENLKGKVEPISETIEELQAKVEPISEEVEDLKEKVEPISEEIDELKEKVEPISEEVENLKGSLQNIEEKLNDIYRNIGDKIHEENVKCYRNLKSLLTELEGNLQDQLADTGTLQDLKQSVKKWKMIAVFSVIDFALLVVYFLYSSGLLDRILPTFM